MGCLSFYKGPLPGQPRGARFLNVDGVRVRYIDTAEVVPDSDSGNVLATADDKPPSTNKPTSDKPTVVLVHGFASAIEAWNPVLPVVAETHRVIALDLKGFGWTDRPKGDYSPDAQAQILLKLLEARGVEKAALVGHSWGSSVALAATLAAPDRVTKLALYNAWVYEEQLPTFFHWARADGFGEVMFGLYYKERMHERMELAFFDKRHITDRLVEDVYSALERPGTVAAALAAVRGQRFERFEQKYRTIDKPTLVLWGREDRVTPPKFGERLSRDLPNAKLAVYPSCGHFPMVEAMDASNRDLMDFLAMEMT